MLMPPDPKFDRINATGSIVISSSCSEDSSTTLCNKTIHVFVVLDEILYQAVLTTIEPLSAKL